MGLINAKCSNCGASLKVDNHSKTCTCTHCGASFITEDIIINNITNFNFSEIVNGMELKRQAVLEKLLTEYYMGRFSDIDTIKEYALKVQEVDLNNTLAHFVVFDSIDSITSIKKLLSNTNLSISLQLFIIFLNVCGDDINNKAIIKNLSKFKNSTTSLAIVKEIITNCRKKDFKFFLNTIYAFNLSESENDLLLDELYSDTKTNKITMLSQLKIFSNSHKDFLYNKQKFNEYAEHWKNLKQKQIAKRQSLIQNQSSQTQKVVSSTKVTNPNKKKILFAVGLGIVLLIILIVLIAQV